MPEVADASVALVVTSPPYYAIKDYGVPGQIGHGQTLHGYLTDLYRVWAECFRVLLPGGRLCVNIGDQFARAAQFGRYKVIPLHAEIIVQAEQAGFDNLGAIIWQKKTTLETSGGAVVMGSFPYPPNGIVELDYEYILLFKKPGQRQLTPEQKEKARLTKEEWKTYFAGHWAFGGARQVGHEAMFPEELPRRLIRMFTAPGETVLDPFLGSGTTAQVALALERNAIGYELNPEYLPLIQARLQTDGGLFELYQVTVERPERVGELRPVAYRPAIQDLQPLAEPPEQAVEPLYRVRDVVGPERLRLDDGREIRLLGVLIPAVQVEAATAYLRQFVRGKQVTLRTPLPEAPEAAYVYLKNRLFINRKMIEMGLALPDERIHHPYRERFIKALGVKNRV